MYDGGSAGGARAWARRSIVAIALLLPACDREPLVAPDGSPVIVVDASVPADDLSVIPFSTCGHPPTAANPGSFRLFAQPAFAATAFDGGQAMPGTAGDFDGDGVTDLVFCGTSASFCAGHGDGTFAPARPISESYVFFADSADFNDDGRLDLLTFDQSQFPSVRLGRGDGTFEDPIAVAAMSRIGVWLIADLDGDGKLDLALAVFPAEVQIWLGRGDGTFRAAPPLDLGPPVLGGSAIEAGSLAAADLDGDHRLDLVLTIWDGDFLRFGDGGVINNHPLRVYLGDGDGTFHLGNVYYDEPTPTVAGLYDFDRDGNLDLLVAETVHFGVDSFSGEYSVRAGHGDATFGDPIMVDGAYLVSTDGADLDGDGYLDLIQHKWYWDPMFPHGLLQVVRGTADFTLAPTPLTVDHAERIPAAWLGAVYDLNCDGRSDVVLVGENTASVLVDAP